MKKVLIIVGLLAAVGCNKKGTVEQTTPTPGVEPKVEVPVEENKYAGAVEFLLDLIEVDIEQFGMVCAKAGGTFESDEEFATCTSGMAGFGIHVVDGVTIGASILVPIEEGQELAKALVAEVGEPDFVADFSAGWELPGFVLVFGPVGNAAWITVLERTE